MGLVAGTFLGPYEIESAIGAGGMGEVYKARDTRLDRAVAIKVLADTFASDEERRARFKREAKTIAGLNHPHICALYDIGDEETSPGTGHAAMYLVMEYLAGETLAARLRKGPLPLEQTVVVATEIADALAAAHRHGVIHRDLKPGNIMLTKSGAKLLDFGLAKLHAQAVAPASVATTLETQDPGTAAGMLLGTVPYMAPEQLEGKEADSRSDIFSFGLVLYEMLTGKRAFEGDSQASIVASILAREPAPVSSIQPLTPPELERLVRQCLAKSPDDRPDTAHDVATTLRWMREPTSARSISGPQAEAWSSHTLELGGSHSVKHTVFSAARVLLLMAIGATLMWLLRPGPAQMSLTHPSLDVRPAEEMNSAGVLENSYAATPGGSRTSMVWTPDGQALVFVGRRANVQQLYVRRLDAAEARPLAGTQGALVPAVSPDGKWIAFWTAGMIRKVPLAGGPVMDVASALADPPWGLAWDTRGRIYFGRGEGSAIWRVSPDGIAAPATKVGNSEVAHILPWPLPDGRTLLYTVRRRQWSWGDEEIVAHNLDTGARKVLLKDAADARYVGTGHLVFLRRGVMFAVPFDAERLELRGTPMAVLDAVAQALTAGNTDYITGAGQFAISASGALAWVRGPVVPYPDATLVAVDRRGQVSPLTAEARSYGPAARVSPDGRRLALMIRTLADAGVWLHDVTRGTTTLLAGGGEAWIPIWSPDGRRLAFEWLSKGVRALAVQPVDGTSPPQNIATGDLTVSCFTPDGRTIAAVRDSRDIVVMGVEPGNAPPPKPLTSNSQHSERWPEFSPDGRWLAYGSDVSGRFEVYVRPYPGPAPAETVSVDGGWSPAWRADGGELFFVSLPDASGKRRLMAVDFAEGSPPRIGRPHELFAFDPRELRFACTPVRCYDVTADGQRFYVTETHAAAAIPPVTHIDLDMNWARGLTVKVPER